MARKKSQPCKTCKARKVKCDENWPSCLRCTSTRRICGGYGIWGGGGNLYEHHMLFSKSADNPMSVPCYMPISVGGSKVTQEERGYLEWFLRRSILKLPGIFNVGFWDTLVLQASSDEPAVLYAILALSAIHHREVFDTYKSIRYDALDIHESFVLRQYNKSIRSLQPHFLSQGRQSSRIALIVCLLFVSLEFLRGNYKAGNIHLRSGLKLVSKYMSLSQPPYDSIDECIMETFIRLNMQVQMFGLDTHHMHTIQLKLVSNRQITGFTSVTNARQHLDCLLNDIIRLDQLCHQSSSSQGMLPAVDPMEAQCKLQTELEVWNTYFTALIAGDQVSSDIRTELSVKFLAIYYTTAVIIIKTCLETQRESIFDEFTDNFVSILSQAIDIQRTIQSNAMTEIFPDHCLAPSESIIDVAWIPVLYYTALKCRVHRIRVHAIKFLESNEHKEGIWDSRLAAYISREVMKMEEGDFYKKFNFDDSFSIYEHPKPEDLSMPVIPDNCRFNKVEMVLPDDYMDIVTLMYKKRRSNGSWEIISGQFERSPGRQTEKCSTIT